MLIRSICCAYNISMSLAKFSMTVNRILQIFSQYFLDFISKKDSDAFYLTGILLFMNHSLIIIH